MMENIEDDWEIVNIDLKPKTILDLALQAHELNITLNQHINNIIIKYLDTLGDK